jgi:SSS family solute:Na+ symporter
VFTVGLSLVTKKIKSDAELKGLVYSLTPHEIDAKGLAWYERPVGLAILVSVVAVILTVMFW